MQEVILGADVVSILSTNQSEQRQALNNALYDGLVGFASAGITTGTFGNDAVNSIEQQRTIGAYYKKVFNKLDVDVNNVAVYLKEISGGKNTDLYNAAEAVLNGDTTDSAIADMMLNGFERSREAQRFVYTKIGEQLNVNNRYIAYGLIRQYDKLSRSGIELSQSTRDTYNELNNTNEDTSRETFNYLVGKLSTTMDAVLPRASVTAEVVKKISNKIEEDGLSRRTATRNDNKKNLIDEDAFVEGMWEDGRSSENSESTENVKNKNFELFDINDKNWYNNKEKATLSTSGNSGEKAKPYPFDIVPSTIKEYLSQLEKYGDILTVLELPSFSDISLMSRQTGTEFASITIGKNHYIIRGDTKGTPISNEIFERVRKNRGTLNCHSHPFIDDFRVSKEDINVAKQMYWQKEFYIVSPDGKFATYDSNGIIDIDIIKKEFNDSDLEFYAELFKEDQYDK